MGHTRARYFPPETGGLIFKGDVGEGGSVFRIDHDQAFQQTTELHYQSQTDRIASAVGRTER